MNGGFDQPIQQVHVTAYLVLSRWECLRLGTLLALGEQSEDSRVTELLSWAKEQPRCRVVVLSEEQLGFFLMEI